MARDFLTGEELTPDDLSALLDRALELKAGRASGEGAERLAGKSVALLFERPSTRTRVSFEVGVAELGGTPLILRGDELQLSRGESAGDTARVLSRYVHAIVVRAGSHEVVEELARGAGVPVINGLTPDHHPCQALADLLTLRERFGDLEGLRIAYVGDGNNVARSLAVLGRAAGVEVRVASPDGYRIEPGLAALDTSDPREAAAGADAIYTDVWVSMGDEDDAQRRRADLGPFQVNAELLAEASERAIVLHCLPAHPGEEVTEEVLYGERSAVWDQAENRLHSQKALLELAAGLKPGRREASSLEPDRFRSVMIRMHKPARRSRRQPVAPFVRGANSLTACPAAPCLGSRRLHESTGSILAGASPSAARLTSG